MAPVHPRPLGSLEHLRRGNGLLWAEAACRLLQRNNGVRAHPRASRPRPLRDPMPLARLVPPGVRHAFAHRFFPVLGETCGARRRRARRGSTTLRRIRRGHRSPSRRSGRGATADRPAWSEGPAAFRHVRTFLLQKPVERPFVTGTLPPEPGALRPHLAPSSTPGFSAGRGGNARTRAGLGRLPSSPREGRRFTQASGAFHRVVPTRGREINPARVARSVRRKPKERHLRSARPRLFFCAPKRLDLTSQASECRSVGEAGLGAPHFPVADRSA